MILSKNVGKLNPDITPAGKISFLYQVVDHSLQTHAPAIIG